MEMQIELYNEQHPAINELVTGTLEGCHAFLIKEQVVPVGKEISFSVAVVDEAEIQRINQSFRKKDEPTDVLSFQYEDTPELLEGEIIVCPSVIAANAAEDGIAFETELKKNLVHGFLHNLGYDHGEEMFEWQEKVLDVV